MVWLVLLLPSLAGAQPLEKEMAVQVQAAFDRLPRPDASADPFARWAYDTAAFTAIHCLRSAGMKPDERLALSPVSNGSWVLPQANQTAKLCASIASTGFQPACVGGRYWVQLEKNSPEFPIDYLQMDAVSDKVVGLLNCYVDAAQVQVQHYGGHLAVEWIQPPAPANINTATGPKRVVMGNVLVADRYATGLDGKPFRQPLIAILKQ